MQLKKFDLVNTDGLKGLSYEGDFIPFDKITDELAEVLEGKTHVLKRKAEDSAAPAVMVATAEPAAEEAPAKAGRSRG